MFHVAMDKMNLGAMQVMFKLMGLNGAHIDAMAVTTY